MFSAPATQDLVLKTMKEHPNNKLVVYAVNNFAKQAQIAAMEAAQRGEYGMGAESIFKAMATVEPLKKKATQSSIYRVDTIRMESRDASTKAVACSAEIYVQLEDGTGAQDEISYKVQNTTDGKLYVTYGLL